MRKGGIQQSSSHYQMGPNNNNTFGNPYLNGNPIYPRQQHNYQPLEAPHPLADPPLMNNHVFSPLMNLQSLDDEQTKDELREFPRHKLRVLEKLGEGAFGMVSNFSPLDQKKLGRSSIKISCPELGYDTQYV